MIVLLHVSGFFLLLGFLVPVAGIFLSLVSQTVLDPPRVIRLQRFKITSVESKQPS